MDGGAGIFNTGTLSLLRSTVRGNIAAILAPNSSGGGLFHDDGTVDIEDSVFDDNTAIQDGGGI